jgi:outer membrane protein TolC
MKNIIHQFHINKLFLAMKAFRVIWEVRRFFPLWGLGGFCFSLFPFLIHAQTIVNLQEAVDMGLKNRLDLKNQQLQISIAENELAKTNTRNLPQVTGTADFRWNTQRQTNVIPIGQNGEPRSVQFGTQFNNLLAINVNQSLYNPNNQSDRTMATVNRQIAERNVEKAQTDIKLAITQAYYAVMLNEEKLRLSENNTQRTKAYMVQARTKFESGALLKTDLERFELDFENAKIVVANDSNNLEVSRQNLANQLGLPINTDLKIKDNLESLLNNTNPELRTESAVESRVEFKQEQLQKQLNEVNYTKQNKNYLPTVSAYGNLSLQQLTDEFNPVASGTWSTFNYVGIKADIPIFDGGQKSRTKQEYKLRQEINQNNLAKLNLDLTYEAQSAKVEIENSIANLHNARRNVQLAEKVVASDKVKSDNANLTYTELRNAEYALQTAQNNLLNVFYNYLLAQVKWQKAVGKL